MQGRIIKGIGGFYYVENNGEIIECKARGNFRNKGLTPVVGDMVSVKINKDGKGVLESIEKRNNLLLRPLVSNVTLAFIVVAVKSPEINLDLLNKFLLQCEINDIECCVVFNKIDLNENYMNLEAVKMIESIHYEYIFTNGKLNIGLDKIYDKIKNNICVFCGPSGVGKSTILNNLVGKEVMKTGEISTKLKRGKHTTRHSELINTCEGFVVDTPGFSNLSLSFESEKQIQDCFPEFYEYDFLCKYKGCLHYKEPKCAVKNAVEEKKINLKRYEFYIKTLEEFKKEGKKW